jgi:hypothetical protein
LHNLKRDSIISAMNKKAPLLLLALALFPLCSCSTSEEISKVILDYGTVRFDDDAESDARDSYMENIDLATLNSWVDKKANFVLLLGKSFDCSCWTAFHKDVLIPYLSKNHIYLPWIEMSDTVNERLFALGLKSENVNASHETIMIFENGEIKYQHTNADKDSDWVNKASVFASWMNERIEKPRLLTINKEQLDRKYAGNEAFSILFTRSTCPDCSFLVDNDIMDYFAAHVKSELVADNYLYALDCDAVGIRYVKGKDGNIYNPYSNNAAYAEQAQTQWNEFKSEYGLAYSSSNPAGWDSGYVPTIFHITPNGKDKSGDVIDYAGVFYNETIDEKDKVITATYFDQDRLNIDALCYLKDSSLKTKTLNGLSMDTSKGNHLALQPYEKPILNALLDAIL